MNRNALYRACLVSLGLSPVALGADPSWVIPTGSWTIPANWNTASVPAAGDNAIIDVKAPVWGGYGNATVNFDAQYTSPLASLKIVVSEGQSIATHNFAHVIQTDPTSILLVDYLNLARSSRGHGQYTLNGGAASVGSMTMGENTRGGSVWEQNGGTFTAQTASLIGGFTGSGLGSVMFAQTGGVSTIDHLETVERAGSTFPGVATVQLSGGVLNVTNLDIGSKDVLTVNGAMMNVGSLAIAGGGSNDITNVTFTTGDIAVDHIAMTGFSVLLLSPGFGELRTETLTVGSGSSKISFNDNSVVVDDGDLEAVRLMGRQSSLVAPAGRRVGYWIVEAGAVRIAPTLSGDADGNATVNLVDFNALASNFNTMGGMHWSDGDFDYDGNVNLVDFNELAANFNLSASTDPTPEDWSNLTAAIPEPSGATFMTVLLFSLRNHWHRRCRQSFGQIENRFAPVIRQI